MGEPPSTLILAVEHATRQAPIRNLAGTLRDHGCDVRVIGLAAGTERSRSLIDGVWYQEVPDLGADGPWHASGRRGRRRGWRQVVGFASADDARRAHLARVLRERRIATRIAETKLEAADLKRQAISRTTRRIRSRVLKARIRWLRYELRRRRDWLSWRTRVGSDDRPDQRVASSDAAALRLEQDLEVSMAPVLDELDLDVVVVTDQRALRVAVEAATRARSADGRGVRLVYWPLVEIGPHQQTRRAALDRRVEDVDLVLATDLPTARRLGTPHVVAPFPSSDDRRASDVGRTAADLVATRPNVGVVVLVHESASSPSLPPLEPLRDRPHHPVVVLTDQPRSADIANLKEVLADHLAAGTLHVVTPSVSDDLRDLFSGADTVLLGPGASDVVVAHAVASDARVELDAAHPLADALEDARHLRWESQVPALRDALATLDGVELAPAPSSATDDRTPASGSGEHPWSLGASDLSRTERRTLRRLGEPVLGIGPRNGNGMAWEWAQALRREHEAAVEVFGVQYSTGRLDMELPCDVSIRLDDWKSLDWQLRWTRHILRDFSHLLIEQGLTALGRLAGRNFWDDLPLLYKHGIQVGLVFRGSELRNPQRHAELEPYSPFRGEPDELAIKLQAMVDDLRPHLDAFEGPIFVTTLDLIDDEPRATWIPHVLDVDRWGGDAPVLVRERPIVVHAPSRERMKGSEYVDAVCEPLHDAGIIEYQRLRGIPFSQMPATLRNADIVIDQFRIGGYGVLAAQAMTSGRLVVGHIRDSVRKHVEDLGGALPIVEATPDDLHDALMRILEDRDEHRRLAAMGPRYIEQFHDGRHSATVLARFMGLVSGEGTR